MSSRLRRSLVLTTLLALLLGVSGTAALTGLAANPAEHQGLRYRRRRDDDPAAPGVHEFAPDELRRADELLSPAYPPAQPDAQRGDHGQPDGPRRRTSGRRGSTQRRPPLTARDSDHRQGQHRHHRHADDGRLLGTRREHARRLVHRAEAEGRRRDHHRQGQPLRVGQLPVRPVIERLERHRWPDEHAIRPRSQPVRLELRLRRRLGC